MPSVRMLSSSAARGDTSISSRGLNGPLDLDPAAWRFTLGDADYY